MGKWTQEIKEGKDGLGFDLNYVGGDGDDD